MSRTMNMLNSVIVGAVYLAVVVPRFGNHSTVIALKMAVRLLFWFLMFGKQFFLVEEMWLQFVIIIVSIAFTPFIYLLLNGPDDDPESSYVCDLISTFLGGVACVMMVEGFSTAFYADRRVSVVLPLFNMPPSYSALAASPLFVNRPLIQHNLASAITANSSSFTTVYGRRGTGRRSIVAKMMMDEEYDALWMAINGDDESMTRRCMLSAMIANGIATKYNSKISRFSCQVCLSRDDSLANIFANWKTDREIFKHTTKHALIVDYSLIDLTKYNNNDPLLHNEVAMLNKIASLGIKVIVICDEMVSIFNAARHRGIDVSFVKVDDLTHDEAVQFFNQIKNSNAVAASISDDEMESLFERVGTRVGDIRNYIDTVVSSNSRVSAKEFGRMMEEYEMKAMMGWMKDHKMDNQFVESQFCTSAVTNQVPQPRRCGAALNNPSSAVAATASDFAKRCADVENEEEQARIIGEVLKNPTGFRETIDHTHDFVGQIKSLSQIIDIDVVTGCNGTSVVSFLPSSTIQKRLIEDGKIVDIKDCFGVKTETKRAIGQVSNGEGENQPTFEMLGMEEKKH